MTYKDIVSALGNRNFFPNTSTIAYFSPNSQTIHLNNISRADIASRSDAAAYAKARSEISTIFHEITHWADLVGTVWGRGYLLKIYEAFSLLQKVTVNGAEFEFWKFADLHDEARRLMLPSYYRTVRAGAPKHHPGKTWGIQFSAGREFDPWGKPDDSRPVLFVKFLDRDTGNQIVRQPLTVGALLEANAMWSEICAGYEALDALEVGVRAVEKNVMERELIESLYIEELTLYTAPAHLISHFTKVTDAALGYRLSSAVAHLSLNLTDDHYEMLRLPEIMRAWEPLFNAFVARRNPAFAYAAICACAQEWNDQLLLGDWLDSALKQVGLPSSRKILDSSRGVLLRQSPSDTIGYQNSSLNYLLEVGISIFDVRSRDLDPSLTLGKAFHFKLPTPPLFDMDGEVCLAAGSTFDLEKFDPTKMHDMEWELEKWTRNFLSSCR